MILTYQYEAKLGGIVFRFCNFYLDRFVPTNKKNATVLKVKTIATGWHTVLLGLIVQTEN